MSMTQLPFHPDIRLIFKGFVITHITDGAATARMESLRNSPCHKPKITITEISPNDESSGFTAFDSTKPFTLNVNGARFPGIQVLQKDNDPFNRLDDENNPFDFRWFVDLGELHGKQVVVDPEKVNPIITVNNGLFFSSQRTTTDVRVRRRDPAGAPLPLKRFGKFALEVTGLCYLNDGGSFVLKNGDDVLPLKPGFRLVVVIDCICNVDPEESDFPFVYDAIGIASAGGIVTSLKEADRVELESDRAAVVTTPGGETYCAGGNVSP